MFIGFFINVLLCGIMITQVYLYGVTFKKYARRLFQRLLTQRSPGILSG